MLAALGAEFGMEPEVDERVGVGAGDDEDRAAVAAVAAARAAARDELLAAEREASASAAARLDVDVDFVDEHRTSDRLDSGTAVTPGPARLPAYSTADADDAAVGAVVLEPHAAGDLGEDRVVLAEAGVQPGTEPAAALAHDDRAARDELPSCALTPSRCEFESRPLRELPCPFL